MSSPSESNPENVLSKRQLQIARRFAEGGSYRTIADELFLAPTTVRTHLRNIYEKLGITNKVSLVHALSSASVVSGGEKSIPLEGGSEIKGIGLKDQTDIRYVASKDGVNIAHASVGDGYPLVIAGSWLMHLTMSWHPADNEGRRLSKLAEYFRLIRYDQRGSGLSDWEATLEFDCMVDDMECVVDSYPNERVAIYGRSQGAAVAIAYSTRRPEKVSHLILQGAYARGRCRRGDKAAEAESAALVTLIREGWAADNPAYRQIMTTLFAEARTPEEFEHFNEFQRQSGTAENIARYREMFDDIDVVAHVPEIAVPTLILHSQNDAIAPLSEAKYLAANIPEAQLILLNSASHLPPVSDPAFDETMHALRQFVYGRDTSNV